MNLRSLSLLALAAVVISLFASCGEEQSSTVALRTGATSNSSAASRRGLANTPVKRYGSTAEFRRSINLQDRILAKGRYGRVSPARPMRPRFITIHSTANPTGDAWAHARALNNGALRAPKRANRNRIGFLIWHYTVQDDAAIQHLPNNEQGEHADFNGPGNNYSIGIEMCENRGNDVGETLDRTARLAAWLMVEHGIPVGGVVPHYHWPRKGLDKPHKPCPGILMDNGRPGETWRLFMTRVRAYEIQLRQLRGS